MSPLVSALEVKMFMLKALIQLLRNWRTRHELSSCLAEDFAGLGIDQGEAKLSVRHASI
jgi:hypothetical protein